ncbi:MAG: hypothetical protein Q9184_005601 [Pyrenodesmia sp. 2 TL-2023]
MVSIHSRFCLLQQCTYTWGTLRHLNVSSSLKPLVNDGIPASTGTYNYITTDPASIRCPENLSVRNIAIIGAGSAGASAAYYLRKFQAPCQSINITIYERNEYVGGRSTTVHAYDDPNYPVELGASIFVKVNHNLFTAAEAFGLPIQSMRISRKSDRPEVLGVWDGEGFVFTQSDGSNSYWNIAKLLWKYGMSPIYTQNLMKKTVGSFLKMYEAPYFPFTSLSNTAYDLDLLPATAVTGQQYLESNGISEHFGHDIIQASTRVNYAQNLDQIHGLETMVCMATDGAMSIEGGNWQIFDSMIKSSGATLLLKSSVTSISKDVSSGKYSIEATSLKPLHPAQDLPSSSSDIAYHTIVLASPLQFSNISFSSPLSTAPSPIRYVSLHVTLFTSPYALSPSYFNNPSTMPTTILTTTTPPSSRVSINDTFTTTTNPKHPPFFSISTLRTLYPPPTDSHIPHGVESICGSRSPTEQEYLYKIFSPHPLSRSQIEAMLAVPTPEKGAQVKANITWLHRKTWNSYPYLPPRLSFDDDIKLDWDEKGEKWGGGGVWYTSGIESFISTMETSSLMGMNVAKLVVEGWGREEE